MYTRVYQGCSVAREILSRLRSDEQTGRGRGISANYVATNGEETGIPSAVIFKDIAGIIDVYFNLFTEEEELTRV